MGSQQLLLIIVGIIIVGAGVVVGLQSFEAALVDGSIDNCIAKSGIIARDYESKLAKGSALGGIDVYSGYTAAMAVAALGGLDEELVLCNPQADPLNDLLISWNAKGSAFVVKYAFATKKFSLQ